MVVQNPEDRERGDVELVIPLQEHAEPDGPVLPLLAHARSELVVLLQPRGALSHPGPHLAVGGQRTPQGSGISGSSYSAHTVLHKVIEL